MLIRPHFLRILAIFCKNAGTRQLDDLKPTQRQLMRVAEDLRNRDLLAATLQAEATSQASRVGPSVVTDEELDAL